MFPFISLVLCATGTAPLRANSDLTRDWLLASSGTESTPVQILNWTWTSVMSRLVVAMPMKMEADMAEGSYKQFCPVAMAAETLCTRWTVVLLRELVAGSTRFNDLRRGVPRMSPALLSKRLRDMEVAGIIERRPTQNNPEIFEYKLTPAGLDLRPVVESIGSWGQRWVETKPTLNNLDAGLLMWDMRRNLNTQPMPQTRSTIQFIYPELPEAKRKWWLIVEPDSTVDLCSVDPGFDVNLYASTDLRTMTEIWLGLKTVSQAKETDSIFMTGDTALENAMQSWLGLSPFAEIEKVVS